MQNKYINTGFYSVIIIFVILCGIGTLYRYKSDIYFDLARHQLGAYIRTGNADKMQWAYQNAIRCNPLEFENYASILNSEHIRLLQGNL